MKRLLLVATIFFSGLIVTAQEAPYVRSVFANSRMSGSYFLSEGAFQNGSSVLLINGKLPVNDISFHTPGNALELSFQNQPHGYWQAKVLLNETRGQDHFKEATHLSFFIYSQSRTIPYEETPLVCLTGAGGRKSKAETFKTNSARGWTQVLIPLQHLWNDSIKSLSEVEAVCFVQNSQGSNGYTIGIDDIEFVKPVSAKVPRPPLESPQVSGYPRHIDISWNPVTDSNVRYVLIYRSENNGPETPVAVQLPQISRYADFVGETNSTFRYRISFLNEAYQESAGSPFAEIKTKELDDEAFLDMIQEAHFRYYWEGAEPNSGLALENILGRRQMIASGASGFGIMALIAGTERKFISRQQAVDRFIRIVNFLEQAETFHGAFSHFIDGPSGKVVPFFGKRDNGGDLVETSFLLQGLLTARQYFDRADVKEKLIRDKIKLIWERVEWDWYRRYKESPFLFWHWSPDQAWIIDHRLIGWNETMITYLLAIFSPTHGVPASMYYSGWASQDSIAQQYRKNWGGTADGSLYVNGNTYEGIKLNVGVSNGGPLFFTHYSFLGMDPRAFTDRYTNYFENNQAIARINYRYCVRNPLGYAGYGDSCWGLTASDGPFNYSADEPVERQDRGKIAPTGAISSFPYTPAESWKALKNYYYNYGKFLWGEYGFRDAFNLQQNWCSEIYMGLNQAPMVVMIENYRSGLLWNLFMKDEDVRKGVEQLRIKNQ